MCQSAISALGLTRGAAHVEFAMTATGPMLFEIGARAGGGHTPQIAHAVSGVDEFVEICRMACGLTPMQLAPIARCGGEYRFLIFPPGQICSVSVPEEVRSHSGVLDVDSLVRPGDILGPIRTVSDRAGFVVTRGNTLLDACELADWACKKIVATYTDGSTSTALIPCPDTEVQG
jgi:L-amino acid ligase C-terminal domain 2